MLHRCEWAKSELEIKYHDHEWGVPIHDDSILFEFLILEGMQAGLSWSTILKRREGMRAAFSEFNPKIIATYTDHYVSKLLQNATVIRNKLKLQSLAINATKFLEIQQEFGSFNQYIWGFVNHTPIVNKWEHMRELPASTAISDQLSKDLKRRGFKFIGTTICYAFMQAVGMVNDHAITCPRHFEIINNYKGY